MNRDLIKACDANDLVTSFALTGVIFGSIIEESGDINEYDSRLHYYPANDYNYTYVTQFLNNMDNRDKLYIPNNITWEFAMDSSQVYDALSLTQMLSMSEYYAKLLDVYGIKVLIYQGQNDPFLVTAGQLSWIDKMEWSGNQNWLNSQKISFKLDNNGSPVGFIRKPFDGFHNESRFTWIEVFNAGHLVPMNQPRVSLEMIANWIYDKPFKS